MSAGSMLDEFAPTSVKTQRGPTTAAALMVSNYPVMAETVKVIFIFINSTTDVILLGLFAKTYGSSWQWE